MESSSADQDALPEALREKLRLAVPGYRLLGILGVGGQARVYKAVVPASGALVAVKILHGGPFADAATRQRFGREIQALRALNHPNIVCCLDSGQTPSGHDFMVMPWIDGRTLDCCWTSQEGSALGAGRGLELFLKICTAVGAAHERGIIHRDLSPSNILIDAGGAPHILDFGLARGTADSKLFAPDSISLTQQFLGKLAYASPEQIGGKPDQITARTDVYALGLILYQMLTGGQFPYDVNGGMADVFRRIAEVPPIPPGERVADGGDAPLDPIHDAIVLKALEKLPADRYASAVELAGEIENCLARRPTVAAASSARRTAAGRRGLRLRRLGLAGLAMTLIIGGAIGWARFHSETTPAVASRPRTPRLTDAQLVPLRQSHQEYVTNSLGMKFVRIEPGEFVMGTPQDEAGRYATDLHQQPVKITQPYLIQATHVTRGQFAAFIADTNYLSDGERLGGIFARDFPRGVELPRNPALSWNSPGFPQSEEHPVVGISWNDAVAFAAWLSEKEHRSYALPTEAQWECAARGGAASAYFWGAFESGGKGFGNVASSAGWNDGFEFTSPVGSFKPNPFGLYDVVGNAWEWCSDFDGPQSNGIAVDPTGPSPAVSNGDHMVRGGAFGADNINLRLGARFGHPPDAGEDTFGFRLVMDSRPPPHPAPPQAIPSMPGRPSVQYHRAIDLLRLVDTMRDNRRPGGWKSQAGKPMSAAASGNELEFPFAVPAEYDLCVVFVPPKDASYLMFFVPAGTHQINWDLGANNNTICGIDLVDGKSESENPTNRWALHWLNFDQRNTVVIKVRKHHFYGYLNGQLVCDYDTDFHEIGLAEWTHFARPDTVGVMFNVPGVVIESAQLVEIQGHGTSIPAANKSQ